MADRGSAKSGDTVKAEGTEDEAIGRPGPWGENRYEKKAQPLDQSVLTPPGTSPSEHKPESTPVTRRDYATSGGAGKGAPGTSENETPGGDAG
jgi:hypothetical protein